MNEGIDHPNQYIPYNPTEVTLYGTPLADAADVRLIETPEMPIGGVKLRLEFRAGGEGAYDVAVIHGYSYEGQCYTFPKPKIMVVPSQNDPAVGCGYGRFNTERGAVGGPGAQEYMMWRVDKLERTLEIEVNQGFYEQLVLEANLPGRRSTSSYRATMQIAHRSGRLVE